MIDDNPRIKLMIDKLVDQVARGHIENDWAEHFIFDMKEKIDGPYPLTEKQIAKLEEIFERY